MQRDWIVGVGSSMLFLRRGCGQDMQEVRFIGKANTSLPSCPQSCMKHDSILVAST